MKALHTRVLVAAVALASVTASLPLPARPADNPVNAPRARRDDYDDLAARAQDQIKAGEYAAAAQTAQKMVELDAKRFEGYVYLGTAQAALKQFDAADVSLAKAVELAPEARRDEVKMVQAAVKDIRAKADAAAAAAERERAEKEYLRLVQEGNAALAEGLRGKAADSYATAVRLFPVGPDAVNVARKAVKIFADMGEYKAAALVSGSLIANASAPDAVRAVGWEAVRGYTGRFEGVRAELLLAAAKAYGEDPQSKRAESLLEDAVRAFPYEPDAAVAYASFAVSRGRAGDGIDAYRRLLRTSKKPVRIEDVITPAAARFAPTDALKDFYGSGAFQDFARDAFGSTAIEKVPSLIAALPAAKPGTTEKPVAAAEKPAKPAATPAPERRLIQYRLPAGQTLRYRLTTNFRGSVNLNGVLYPRPIPVEATYVVNVLSVSPNGEAQVEVRLEAYSIEGKPRSNDKFPRARVLLTLRPNGTVIDRQAQTAGIRAEETWTLEHALFGTRQELPEKAIGVGDKWTDSLDKLEVEVVESEKRNGFDTLKLKAVAPPSWLKEGVWVPINESDEKNIKFETWVDLATGVVVLETGIGYRLELLSITPTPPAAAGK